MGGTLAMPRTEAVQKAIHNAAKKIKTWKKHMWIGVHKEEGHSWTFVDGSPIHSDYWDEGR